MRTCLVLLAILIGGCGVEPSCTDGCVIGATECRGDGVVTCERSSEGCGVFGAPVACAPFSCSLGECSSTCTDECTSGETRCERTSAMQTCGEGDSDSCTDWLAPVACAAGVECASGACPSTCADPCNTPPAATCTDSSTLRTYATLGTCNEAGGCDYASTDMTCAEGCASGRCTTTGCSPTPVTVTTANTSPPAASDTHSSIFDGYCGAAVGQIFPPSAPWNQSVRTTCVAPESQAIVEYLEAIVTDDQTFRIDMGTADDFYGFNPLAADDSVTHRQFAPTGDFYPTHCDRARIPVPLDGRLEAEPAYVCTTDGDCHLNVFDTAECRLFEMWRANDVLGTFEGGCLAVWTNTEALAANLRGLSCTSAEAGGFPIMPMLVTPQEIARGRIEHALRFTMTNDAVQRFMYVRPATHNPLNPDDHGDPATGPSGTMPPPYGIRLRLRADFPTTGLSHGATVMIEALKEYGMFHADGGDVTFIASNDVYSTHRWDDPAVELGPNDLRDSGLRWTDFEVVSDLSDVESMETTECSRTPLSEF
jgi:hypothetical protein